MTIFLAGASGVIGVRLVPLLATVSHDVAGMTRSPEKCEALRELGATPVLCDVFDVAALRDAVVGFRPELVLHQLTDLPDDEARIPGARIGQRADAARRDGQPPLGVRRRRSEPLPRPRASPGSRRASRARPSGSSSGWCSTPAAPSSATVGATAPGRNTKTCRRRI